MPRIFEMRSHRGHNYPLCRSLSSPDFSVVSSFRHGAPKGRAAILSASPAALIYYAFGTRTD